MKNTIRTILYFFLLSLVPCLATGRAEEKPGAAQSLSEFAEIKMRLANVEKQQQEIITKDNLILEKLDQLRVWVHRK